MKDIENLESLMYRKKEVFFIDAIIAIKQLMVIEQIKALDNGGK